MLHQEAFKKKWRLPQDDFSRNSKHTTLGPILLADGEVRGQVLVVDSVSFLFLFLVNSSARQFIIPAKKEKLWHQVCGSALDKEVLILFQFL